MVQTKSPKRNNLHKRKFRSIDSIYSPLHCSSNSNMKRIHLSSVFSSYKHNYGSLTQSSPKETYSKTTQAAKEGIVYVKGPFGTEKKISRITKMHFLKPTSLHSQLSPLETLNEKFNSLNSEYKQISLNTMRSINIGDDSAIKEPNRFNRIAHNEHQTIYIHNYKHRHNKSKHNHNNPAHAITSINARIHSFTTT